MKKPGRKGFEIQPRELIAHQLFRRNTYQENPYAHKTSSQSQHIRIPHLSCSNLVQFVPRIPGLKRDKKSADEKAWAETL